MILPPQAVVTCALAIMFDSSTLIMIDASIFLFGTLYFWFVSSHYLYFLAVGYILQIWALLASFCLPESPRLLIALHRFDEGKESFKKIARCNNRKLKGWDKEKLKDAN